MNVASYQAPPAAWTTLVTAQAKTPATSRPSSSDELPSQAVRGRVLSNRYLPEQLLEQRAHSLRYQAYDLALNENVHVEFLPRSALRFWSSVRQTITKLAASGHPQIVEVVGHGMLAGAWPFIVTEGIAGPTLRQLLAGTGPLGLVRALRIGAACARALGAAHGAGVSHGAFGPDQVFVIPSVGAADAVKVGGFGVAPLVLEWHGSLFACPERCPYVSPEQIEGTGVDPRSDVYALGAVLSELITGRPAFTGEAAVVLAQHLGRDLVPPSVRQGSREPSYRAFDKIVSRCLAKSPERRYQSARALAADLERLEAALSRASGCTPHAVAPKREERTSSVPASGLFSVHRPAPRARVAMHCLPKVIVNQALPEGAEARSGGGAEPRGAQAQTEQGRALNYGRH